MKWTALNISGNKIGPVTNEEWKEAWPLFNFISPKQMLWTVELSTAKSDFQDATEDDTTRSRAPHACVNVIFVHYLI